ncbi:hypothetical protein OH76DRAFT_1396150 [Lentinus brumalis]|uniref:Uncharacterized protein n=1 Tax=Lentinus brumalis TaxID=2498619 RepID=A0A371DTD3_9APHY|nr:hypothetical protein OH76DRAFT_1396150 [Polyporus brumalis]
MPGFPATFCCVGGGVSWDCAAVGTDVSNALQVQLFSTTSHTLFPKDSEEAVLQRIQNGHPCLWAVAFSACPMTFWAGLALVRLLRPQDLFCMRRRPARARVAGRRTWPLRVRW